MARSLPDAPKWDEPKPAGKQITLHLKTITPMFGGGFEPRETDPISPVRAAAIRGHLRFWWRALYGAAFENAEQLFAAEEKLWGSAAHEVKEGDKIVTKGPGQVSVRVQVLKPGELRRYSQVAPKAHPRHGPQHGVFLFPFQQQNRENIPEANCRTGLEFQLELAGPDSAMQEIEDTIRIWLTFGGIGARTRRGCGALTVEREPQNWLPPVGVNARRQWFSRLIRAGGNRRDAFHTILSGASVVVAHPRQDPVEAWRELGVFWSRFRKGHVGSHEYSPMSGAKWNDYRTLSKSSGRDRLELAKPFLGLPIIFQRFRGARFSGTLEPAESGRMASPVIMKPLAHPDGSYSPMVVVLRAPEPERIKIDSRVVELRPPASDPVLRDLQANDPLEAVAVAAERLWHVNPEVLP